MKFKYHFLSELYRESIQAEASKDPHLRLNLFERKVREYLFKSTLSADFLEETARVLRLINRTQDHITESLVGHDLDGDGQVGPVKGDLDFDDGSIKITYLGGITE